MKLTKENALIICAELWTWLAENPGKKKEDWPGWEKYGGMHDNCPCCEYGVGTSEEGIWRCFKCPLRDYWSEDETQTCTDEDSPYDVWCFDFGNTEAANQIALACFMELSRMEVME